MNYTELKTEISDYLHRANLSTKADVFIDLFEARASRKIRTVEMQLTEIVVPTSELQALPVGWQSFRNIQLNTSPIITLEYATPQKIAGLALTSGSARYYTISGNQVEFSPSASGANIEWTYYKDITPLSDTNLTNWLIAKHPEYYLMGCLYQALIYTVDARSALMEQNIMRMESEINSNDSNAMSGPLRVSAV